MVDDIYEKKSTSGNNNGLYDTFEVVDVDVVKPEDVDLGLDDAPFEIGMDAVKRMDEEEAARKQALINVQAETTIGKKIIYKDMMFTRLDNILDAYQADKRRTKVAIITLITFICSILPFWGIKIKDLTLMVQSNLFNGYDFLGIGLAGKLFVLCLVASLILMSINLKKWALRINLVGWVAYLIQVVMILIWAPIDFSSSTVSITILNIRPHIGTITTFLGQLVLTIMYTSISKHSPQTKQGRLNAGQTPEDEAEEKTE